MAMLVSKAITAKIVPRNTIMPAASMTEPSSLPRSARARASGPNRLSLFRKVAIRFIVIPARLFRPGSVVAVDVRVSLAVDVLQGLLFGQPVLAGGFVSGPSIIDVGLGLLQSGVGIVFLLLRRAWIVEDLVSRSLSLFEAL